MCVCLERIRYRCWLYRIIYIVYYLSISLSLKWECVYSYIYISCLRYLSIQLRSTHRYKRGFKSNVGRERFMYCFFCSNSSHGWIFALHVNECVKWNFFFYPNRGTKYFRIDSSGDLVLCIKCFLWYLLVLNVCTTIWCRWLVAPTCFII